MRRVEEIYADAVNASARTDARALAALALELDEHNSQEAEALVSFTRGKVLVYNGEVTRGIELLRHAQDLYRQIGDRRGLADVLQNIGASFMDLGQLAEVLECSKRALELYKELDYTAGAAACMASIGSALHSSGDLPGAMEHYHKALDKFSSIEYNNGIATMEMNIGIIHRQTGKLDLALASFEKGRELYRAIGNQYALGEATLVVGTVLGEQGDYDSALKNIDIALTISREVQNAGGVADALLTQMNLQIERGLVEDAKVTLTQIDDTPFNSAYISIKRGLEVARLEMLCSNLEEAKMALIDVLSLTREHGFKDREAEASKLLRDLSRTLRDFDSYVAYNDEYTRITEEINGKDTATKLAMQEAERRIASERQEHEKHLAILHSTLPRDIADRVARGETVNDHHERTSVIFLDIVGFSTISDRMPSSHVVHLLEQVFSTLEAVCEKHDVTKIKTIGDSFMAVAFDGVGNAAHCALEMMASIDALEITMPTDLGDVSGTNEIGGIQVRIGVHCGPVTAGVIGTQRLQYDVWGDTVNVASRMESTGEPGRIQCSESFARALCQVPRSSGESDQAPGTWHQALVERGTIDIKGKGTMTTYWLEGA